MIHKTVITHPLKDIDPDLYQERMNNNIRRVIALQQLISSIPVKDIDKIIYTDNN